MLHTIGNPLSRRRIRPKNPRSNEKNFGSKTTFHSGRRYTNVLFNYHFRL